MRRVVVSAPCRSQVSPSAQLSRRRKAEQRSSARITAANPITGPFQQNDSRFKHVRTPRPTPRSQLLQSKVSRLARTRAPRCTLADARSSRYRQAAAAKLSQNSEITFASRFLAHGRWRCTFSQERMQQMSSLQAQALGLPPPPPPAHDSASPLQQRSVRFATFDASLQPATSAPAARLSDGTTPAPVARRGFFRHGPL